MVRILVLLLLILAVLISPVSAQGKVRLVVMDGINLEHLTDPALTNFRFLLEYGAVGLANANTAGGRTPENTALTLGSGSRALGPGGGYVLHWDDEMESSLAGDVQTRRTGILPPQGSLVVPAIAQIADANADLMHIVQVGYLAATLDAGGRTVAALVNADTHEINRPAAAIVADVNGIIQAGQVGQDLLQKDPSQPFGLQSDLAQFVAGLQQLDETDFVVIDLGDTSRALSYSGYVLEEIRLAFRQQALVQLDLLLGYILDNAGEDDLLLVTGLQSDRILGSQEGKLLTPVLAYGRGFAGGLLTSPTTRRRGVIANYDITATILQRFDLYTPGEIHGQPMSSLAAAEPLPYLLAREQQMAMVYKLRAPLVKAYIGIIIILVGLSLAALFFNWRRRAALKLAVASVVASPLILLLLGAISGSYWMIALWPLLAIGLALVLGKLRPEIAMPVLGAITALTVVGDALLGAWLQQRSILGYDAIAGARYYGIGNEYMGVLLGSTLLAVSGFLVRRKELAGLIFAAVTIILMLPGVGANFGGTLSALLGFTAALTGMGFLRNKRHRWLAVLVFLGAGLVLVLLNIGSGQSHVGRFFAVVVQEPAEFWLAVQRKVNMAWRLVRWSLWSRAFAALFLGAMGMMYAKRHFWVKKLGAHWPHVRGAMVAALAALFLNDSGVVAAALILLYLTLPLLYYEFSSSSWLKDSHSR